MKQRVAVARALSLEPKVLLMDEPFAALDATTRTQLQNLTKQVCEENGVTVVFVTHNVEEAVLMGNRIVIMSSKTGNIDRIIDNNVRHTKESRAAVIAEIIDILDNQLSE
jgi:NitT/TauT family transport system ATP-binding protein